MIVKGRFVLNLEYSSLIYYGRTSNCTPEIHYMKNYLGVKVVIDFEEYPRGKSYSSFKMGPP